jgi:regulator of sigma E protease
VAAGPLANFLLAIVLYAGLFMHGIEEPSSKLGPAAGQTAAYGRPAQRRPVESVNGKAVASWSELRWELIQAALDKQTARIDVRRPDRGMQEAILPTAGLTEADLEGDVLGKLGLTLAFGPTMMEIMPAAPRRAPAAKGDEILAIDGQPVQDVGAIIDTLSRAPGRTLHCSCCARAGPDRAHHAGSRAGRGSRGSCNSW